MAYFAGIDCGTQSTKVIIADSCKGIVIGEGSASHDIITGSDGTREQKASWWIESFFKAFELALQNAGVSGKDIAGLGVSGQQHGFVPLDKDGNVLYNVKLWCDTSTYKENAYIVEKAGGEKRAFELLGLMPQTGYTVSKILWFKNHYPDLYKKLDCVMLPHDYLNYFLTGNRISEFGDASGSGILNIRTKTYSQELIDIVDDSGILEKALLPLSPAQGVIGVVRKEISDKLGLSDNVIVSTGGGDNMMAAIGTGNIEEGIITLSLGTSGTLFTYTDKALAGASPLIANFCSSNNGYLPLICTMNITSATSLIQNMLGISLETFNSYLESTPAGANGITMLPFFNGERVPALPDARASLFNLDAVNMTAANLCTAVTEAATFGLRYALDLFKEAGINIHEIRLTGGGAKSKAWRRIIANTFNTPVVCLKNQEAASLGAAIQAMWAHEADASNADLKVLCDKFVSLDQDTEVMPSQDLVIQYDAAYTRYLEALNKVL